MDLEVLAWLKEKQITEAQMKIWLKIYENEIFVEKEILKMMAWLLANPQRAPRKNYSRFITTWLSRAWDQFRKTIPTRPVLQKDREAAQKIMDGGKFATGVKMRLNMTCDVCFFPMLWEGFLNELENKKICARCDEKLKRATPCGP